MQLTPSQVGMELMLRGKLPMMPYQTMAEGIARGRQHLILCTGQDFGYDLLAWHEYLVKTNDGGYLWSGSARGKLKSIQAKLADEKWQHAAATAEAEGLLEKMIEKDRREREAELLVERTWAGKFRSCPKCQASFKSVQDRGQCPKCGYLFRASQSV